MTGPQITVPRRIAYIRILVTLALLISFPLSFSLWGAETYFPDIPVSEHFYFEQGWAIAVVALSMLSLLVSLFANRHRLFLFLSVCCNIFLVVSDMNRLQPWFYIYNALLIILLFYDGRVDNPRKYMVTFILLQLVIASLYVFNGLSHLGEGAANGEISFALQPLSAICSARQFGFIMKAGRLVPFLMIFTSLGLMFKPLRYLAVTLALFFHAGLFILLFPSAEHFNYALWFMNLVFLAIIPLLFSGQTTERNFAKAVVFQRPLFYLLFIVFWIFPVLNLIQTQQGSFPVCTIHCSQQIKLEIEENAYCNLPLYLRHFCEKGKNSRTLDAGNWCRHELNAECIGNASVNRIFRKVQELAASPNVKETEEQLASSQ